MREPAAEDQAFRSDFYSLTQMTQQTMPNLAASLDSEMDDTQFAPREVELPKPRLHLDFLDGLRALAALGVLVDHAFSVVWAKEGYMPAGWASPLRSLLLIGHFAVTTFIVLSGFCLMLPVATGGGVLRGGARAFYFRRIKRILPPYYFATLLSLLLIATVIGKPTGSHWDTSIPVDAQGVWTHILLIHNLFPHSLSQINNVLWSIAVEFQIYIWFPLLVWLWRRIGGGAATLTVVTASGIGYFLVHNGSWWGLTPHYYGIFAIGALAAGIAYHPSPLYQRLRNHVPTAGLCVLTFAIVIVYCIRLGLKSSLEHLVIRDFLVGAGTSLLLILAARSPATLARRALSCKPLVFLGTYSFSIYLLHVPLQQIFWQYILWPRGWSEMTQFCVLLLAGTPIILVAAYLFFIACERPFMNTKPKIH